MNTASFRFFVHDEPAAVRADLAGLTVDVSAASADGEPGSLVSGRDVVAALERLMPVDDDEIRVAALDAALDPE